MPLNSPLGRNSRFNLVAACHKCNLEKSDKVDYRVVKGYASKVLESTLFTIQKGFILVFVAVWWVIQQILHTISEIFWKLPLLLKLVIIIVILIIVFH